MLPRDERPYERLVRYEELAEMLDVGLTTVKKWRKEGMPVESDKWPIKVVRIKPSEARQWLESRKPLNT